MQKCPSNKATVRKQLREMFHGTFLKTVVSLLILVVVIGIGIWQLDLLPWGKVPIDGNVLNLPYIAEWEEGEGIVSPWKNVQFHTTLMFRNLFLAKSTSDDVEMDLAESYRTLDDGMCYEIVMKDGIVWSDGEPITAEDVAFSIESVLLANDANAIYTAAFSHIEGAQAFMQGEQPHVSGLEVKNNTLTMKMMNVYPAMVQVLAQFVILPKHVLEHEEQETLYMNAYWMNPVVSGMYKIGEIVPFQTVQLVRNEAYEGKAPLIEEVLLHMDYKHADLDYYSTNNTTEIINYRSMRAMEGYEIDTLFYRYFVFNRCGVDGNQNEAMQDPKVRQAIACAIDREGALQDIYFHSGAVLDSGVPRNNAYYNGVEITYDPQKAIQLLSESSYDLTRPLRLIYYYKDSVSTYFMERVAEDLKAVGFNVEIKMSQTTDELYQDREYDLMLKGLSAFSMNEWYSEYSVVAANLANLMGGVTEFEPLVNQLNTQVDQEQKRETLQKLQGLENELMYKLPLFTLSQMLFIREERLCIPEGIVFGNSWYRYDVDFEKWYIKTERVRK